VLARRPPYQLAQLIYQYHCWDAVCRVSDDGIVDVLLPRLHGDRQQALTNREFLPTPILKYSIDDINKSRRRLLFILTLYFRDVKPVHGSVL